MSRLKQLAGQTAVYGLSSILARVFNYFLTPLYTGIFSTESFGIISELYSYIAVVLALLTFGMETSLFNFSRNHEDKNLVFSTAQFFVTALSLLFFLVVVVFSEPIAYLLRYPGYPEYVILFSLIIVLDSLASVPMAKLRELNKPMKFATINIINIAFNVGFNIFFLVYCRSKYAQLGDDAGWIVNTFYNNNIGVGYVFISNIIGSGIKLLLLSGVITIGNFKVNFQLLRQMLKYASPLALGAFCFIINEKTDLLFLKYLLPKSISMQNVGVYSACYKLAMIMTIFIQAFRFAAEPFFFMLEKEKNARRVYADIMKYFVIFCLGIFLMVTLYIDFFKHFLRREEYWQALQVVPILLIANLFSGVYQNLSMWYKLSGATKFGMYFSLLGALITIVFNILLIPIIGYYGSAWATFICYGAMMMVSFYIGQKNYRIPYELKYMFSYVGIALLLFAVFSMFTFTHFYIEMIVATALFLTYLSMVIYRERKLFTSIKFLKRLS